MSECIPSMKEAGAGSIVNVSSVNGMQSFAGTAAYCASKAAVDMLTQCAAVDLAEFQIRVNSVNPGVVVTELQKRGGLDEEKYAAFLERSRTVTHPVRWWMPLEMVAGGPGADKKEPKGWVCLTSRCSAWRSSSPTTRVMCPTSIPLSTTPNRPHFNSLFTYSHYLPNAPTPNNNSSGVSPSLERSPKLSFSWRPPNHRLSPGPSCP
jgi:hypothetical protein